MARYIERELLLNALKEERKNGNFVFTSKWIKEIMDKLPTADVAPKTEVAREIFEEIDLIFRKQFERCSEKTELKLLEPLTIAERFVINEMWHEVAELKKKYTEEMEK